MTEMTIKMKEGIVKAAKTCRLTGPECSSFGNTILLAAFRTLVCNFNIIFCADDCLKDNIMILNAYQVVCVIIADQLIVVIWNFFSGTLPFLILQLRTKDQRTSPGACEKNFLLTRKVHLIYSLTGTTDFFIILSLREYLFFYYTSSFTWLLIFIEKKRFFFQFHLKSGYVSFISCYPITLYCISERFSFFLITHKSIFRTSL